MSETFEPKPVLSAPPGQIPPARTKKVGGKRKVVAAAGENTGRWTAEEHALFLQGLEQHGKGWKKIASLIKSRTVVQIRTHAQKYFQKLAKARQNGDQGDIVMEVKPRRRPRQWHATKRKAISSVVASAVRHKRVAISPALAPFVVKSTGTSGLTGPALEDSLFRFLTPVPVAPPITDVARAAGANPIAVPSSTCSSETVVSPTGVAELYPSWTDAKDPPSWYHKGEDVETLLDTADGLDWLTDSGDDKPLPSTTSVTALPDAMADVPPLPSLQQEEEAEMKIFDSAMEEDEFVSAILEQSTESNVNLASMH